MRHPQIRSLHSPRIACGVVSPSPAAPPHRPGAEDAQLPPRAPSTGVPVAAEEGVAGSPQEVGMLTDKPAPPDPGPLPSFPWLDVVLAAVGIALVAVLWTLAVVAA